MKPSLTSARVAESFVRRFIQRAGSAGVLSFADFMELALFDAEAGYYAGERTRVGHGAGTDFFTSASLGSVFGRLISAAAVTLLGESRARECKFIEIGAEPGCSVLRGVDHVFAAVRTIEMGQPLEIAGAAVVFANELFDAQPFHRLVFRDGAWLEQGVRLTRAGGEPGFAWTDLETWSPELESIRGMLPRDAAPGYVLDVPRRAVALLDRISAQPWCGLFLTLDYGRTWRELTEDYPQGTGRAYAAHRQAGDLLATPGEQDLTCHVCWDWLEEALRRGRFDPVRRASQESFLVRHASSAMESIVTRDRNPLSRERTELKQLLHPALLGQRFEALWGLRS
jgi:SAM-dependent MidA family methyltransferase